MRKTKISWTNAVWNVVTGCTKYSAGCAHCYAETLTKRFPKAFPNGFNVTLHPERLDEPKHVKKPTMFFVCSMADLFHDDVPFEYIDRVMQTIRDCPQHTFQILTKRTIRMRNYYLTRFVPRNALIGTTVESNKQIGRIKLISGIGIFEKSKHFLSCEPLLSDLGELDLTGIDWVIVGGESGNQARPMQKEWVLNIKRQCEEQGVPFFFKSWGRYGEDGKPCPKGQRDLLDGVKYQAYPKGWEKGETK
jgi:protein gp37